MRLTRVAGIAMTFFAVSILSIASVSASNDEANTKGGGIALTNEQITPFASQKVDGGTWSYGTSTKSGTKTVYSNYWHPDKNHGSSAQLGSRTPDRDCVGPDKESKASQSAKTNDTGYAYYNLSCTP
ncbi:lactococcin 972 family bacteriocin [Sporosarcina sp. Te-1]|uniref:lactococcin 972 family bacteriocin n=1 Tax=Sporosarcina sp. Te-1 TaxID=2818390 RepID=UPI001A9D8B2B|nr:lactococcin 972 family bacteriocin [Sporosarcina sp. Te-1]QTD42770.1 hypothetical protein J3U78_08380 [Sporosarcina sp. Te-1]